MNDEKKIGNIDLKELWKSLEGIGVFAEFLSDNVARIICRNNHFIVKKTGADIVLVFDNRQISLRQYGLKPLLERAEDEYKTKSLFIVF